MPDFATNDFLKKYGSKFGEIDFDASGVKTSLNPDEAWKMNNDGVSLNKESVGSGKKLDMGKAAGIAGTVASAAPQAMGLLDNLNGGQFDTSAEGGGVGKASGAILQGAGQGAQLGQTIGSIAGPMGAGIGAAVGAVGGGLISSFAHTEAQKEFRDNRNKFNVKEDALERNTREDEYRQSEGLAALDSVQNLRKKQLGIIS